MFFSHGSNHQKDVCTLINIQIDNYHHDSEGRIVLINASLKSVNLSICNIYAPNNIIDQQKFAQIVEELLMSKALISNLIIGGDWNVTLHAIDKKGGIRWQPTAYRNQIIR